MNINELLGGVVCSCGRTHTCGIECVHIEKNAITHLTQLCGEYQHILLVADENTFAAAGEKTVAALSGKEMERCIFDGKKLLVPNEAAVAAVNSRLEGIELIIGIGSGVIQDLCKYVSFESKLPYMIVATAPSMDGYASNGAAMIMGGMKVTYSAGLPKAIVADPQVLANAPMRMLQAGYGDIIGKLSALNDWKLSQAVNGEYFCRYIYDLTYAQIGNTLSLAQGILQRNEESVRALMEALIVVGILMRFAGSSRPASGSEHHLSHFFEITGILDGTDYFPHGIDVAYSTVITAQLRQKILGGAFPENSYRCPPAELERRIKAVYGDIGGSCMELQRKTGNYAADRAAVYLEKEAELRAILAQMPPPEEIEKMLSLVGLDMKEFYGLYGRKKIDDAIQFAKDLKDRYTVLWLYYDIYGGEQNVSRH